MAILSSPVQWSLISFGAFAIIVSLWVIWSSRNPTLTTLSPEEVRQMLSGTNAPVSVSAPSGSQEVFFDAAQNTNFRSLADFKYEPWAWLKK